MADLGGLFTSPDEIRAKRFDSILENQAATARMGGSMAGLLGQVAAGGYNTGALLAEGAAGMFGLKTPEEAKAEQVQSMFADIDSITNPDQLLDRARKLSEMGYLKEAIYLGDRARSIKLEDAREARAQTAEEFAQEMRPIQLKSAKLNLSTAQTDAEWNAKIRPLQLKNTELTLANSALNYNREVAASNIADNVKSRINKIEFDPTKPLDYYTQTMQIAQEEGDTELFQNTATKLFEEQQRLDEIAQKTTDKRDKLEARLMLAGSFSDDPYIQAAYTLGEMDFTAANNAAAKAKEGRLTAEEKAQQTRALNGLLASTPQLANYPQISAAIAAGETKFSDGVRLAMSLDETAAANQVSEAQKTAIGKYVDTQLNLPKYAPLAELARTGTITVQQAAEMKRSMDTGVDGKDYTNITNYINADTGEQFLGGIIEGVVYDLKTKKPITGANLIKGAPLESTKPADRMTTEVGMATIDQIAVRGGETWEQFKDKATEGWGLGVMDSDQLAAAKQRLIYLANDIIRTNPQVRDPEQALRMAMQGYVNGSMELPEPPATAGGVAAPTNDPYGTIQPPR